MRYSPTSKAFIRTGHGPRPGPSVADYPLVRYVTDGIASAMAQAKAAAGDRYVLVHGAYTAQRALEAGVLDQLVIQQIPVLFGSGRRQFEVLPSRGAGDRSSDRHAGGHTPALPRASLSRSRRWPDGAAERLAQGDIDVRPCGASA
jgi:hypothetical protein